MARARPGSLRDPATPEAVLTFLRDHPAEAGVREIARAFNLGPAEQPALRELLRRIERSGRLVRTGARKFAAAPPLPELIQVERFGTDPDGYPLVRPVAWSGAGEAPVFRVVGGAGAQELALGERAAARPIARDTGDVEAEVIGRPQAGAGRIVGVFRRGRNGGTVIPTDRRDRLEYRVEAGAGEAVAEGELVVAETLPTRRSGPPRARILERLGPAAAPGAISLLTIAAFEIPTEFPAAALAEAAAAAAPDPSGRADLREIALVTIDGEDARDFDDAVWAEPDSDAGNRGGWHLIVAIADVAAYVAPGSPLDQEAERRGNSVYFPDRVVPMLPEALSNGWCSLVPGEERACLAVHLWIDAAGRKRRHRVERALMRSAARLTYDQVQMARDGRLEPPPLAPERLAALYGAFAALNLARRARGALELDLVEHRVVVDAAGRPVAVVPRPRLDSHRLIEEFMVLANVAAAEEAEKLRQPCMYRVHDAPNPEKLAALRDFLAELRIPGLALAKGQRLRPELFNRILERAATTPSVAPIVNEMVLRAQAQAAYSPNNIGHFGLALPRYAHFTSPIRRYADLLVHRTLIAGLNRGGARPVGDLGEIGEHISATERRAAAAERDALGRYRALLLTHSLGSVFEGRITGVAPFGLFITLRESGADGLVPVASLGGDYYQHDARRHRLVGRRFGQVFALGDPVTVRLVEADPIGGRLVLRVEQERSGAPASPETAGRAATCGAADDPDH